MENKIKELKKELRYLYCNENLDSFTSTELYKQEVEIKKKIKELEKTLCEIYA